MRQLFQHLDSGETALVDVPSPQLRSSSVLIRNTASLVSAGTERMLVEFGQANALQKARQQPEKVRQVLDKARTDGLHATVASVRNQLGQPLPLGYCSAGIVEAVGSGVHELTVGDRVASNGPHAELVAVGGNLIARIPQDVSFEDAAFAPLAAIALQGTRLAVPTLGERFVVIGLGLVGLLTAQILRAHGCEVLGVDVSRGRVELARSLGLEAADASTGQDPVESAQDFTKGVGADGVLIAAATKSDEPVRQAAEMCRKKGRIVLVGVTGLHLSRQLFYERELSFQVSTSYGPGRYDSSYEERGIDYPLPYVRWTEGRNFEAVLGLMASGKLDVEPLVSHRFAFDDAPAAYELLSSDAPSLGIVLEYPHIETQLHTASSTVDVAPRPSASPVGHSGARSVGVIGAGNYATATLLPALRDLEVNCTVIASSSGAAAGLAAKRFGFNRATSYTREVLEADDVQAVFVLTRHDSHADLATAALRAGKAVFVEKPLAITRAQLEQLRELSVGGRPMPVLTVGFNRRFSPHVQRIAALLKGIRQPKAMVMTVNAGRIPSDHWLNDPDIGGGRLIGEGCHFIDLLRYLAAAPIEKVQSTALDENGHGPLESFAVTLGFADGSLGTVHYLSNGHRRYPKERLDVFAGGRTLTLDNFTRLRGHGWPGFRGMRTRRQDKGHRALVGAFLAAVAGAGPAPIPVDELFEVSAATLEAADTLRA